jgi:hypothetical protein
MDTFQVQLLQKKKQCKEGLSCDTNDKKRIETEDRRSLNLPREIQVFLKIKKT